MPYIPQDQRPAIDAALADFISHIRSLPTDKQDGALNYAFSTVIYQIYEPSYYNYNRAMGMLASVQAELYRRKVAPYEDEKIAKNGDV